MTEADQTVSAPSTATAVLLSLGLCHMLNDVMQSMLEAIYPILKQDFVLAYWQVGAMTLAFMGTASLLQPVIGFLADRRPIPWLLPAAMAFTCTGVLLLSIAPAYPVLLVGAVAIGLGSSIFHPEASRVARAAAGGRYGLAQSVFQVGGNFGSSLGPLLAAFIVVPLGRGSVGWFALAALVGLVILSRVSAWHGRTRRGAPAKSRSGAELSRRRVVFTVGVLVMLLLSKYVYTASLSSFYTFYLIERFGLPVRTAQVMLFLFLGAMALGTILGGPIGDRIGPRRVIWVSILGALPFTLALPHLGPVGAGVATVCTGLIIASSFPAIVVFAQEMIPGRVGLVAGMFFGFAFGIGGVGAVVLGLLADSWGIEAVFRLCAWLPALGVLAVLLPKLD